MADTPVKPSFTVSLTKDVMRALLNVTPGTDPQERLTLEDIVAAGGRLGVRPEHFNPETLGAFADAWNRKREIVKDWVIAESGNLPKKGANGRIEWLIRVPWADDGASGDSTSLSKERDLREVKTIVGVEAGQRLLRVFPPEPGKPGEDLMGRSLPALAGQPAPFAPGVNLDEAPGEPGVWVAKQAGFLRINKDGRPEVQECFTVEGDVDYATGNIKYQRSAEIRGDVQDGFGVAVGGDLAVGGTVGDCRIVVGGNILVRGGYQGKGQGRMLAKGAVTLGFGSQQSVRALGPIEVMKEAYGMQLFTRETLTVHGPLVGGRVVAGLAVHCAVAGNDLGTPTLIELGCDYTLLEGLAEVDARLKEYGEAQGRFQARFQALREAYRTQKKMDSETARELVAIREALDKLGQALPILQSRRAQMTEALRKGLQRGGLQVRVDKQVHAGVTVKVGAEQVRLSETLAGPRRFAFEEGRIKVF